MKRLKETDWYCKGRDMTPEEEKEIMASAIITITRDPLGKYRSTKIEWD